MDVEIGVVARIDLRQPQGGVQFLRQPAAAKAVEGLAVDHVAGRVLPPPLDHVAVVGFDLDGAFFRAVPHDVGRVLVVGRGFCSAATTALFPQLFGPTSTVSPAAGSMTVCSCDMKLVSSMRVIMRVANSQSLAKAMI